MQNRIVAIDGNLETQTALLCNLQKVGFDVEVADDKQAGLKLAYTMKPDLIIIDPASSNLSGQQFCNQFRILSNIPIMILTYDDDENTIVKTLNAGADVYLIRPVSKRELSMRIKALLRRTNASETSPLRPQKTIHQSGIVVDHDSREVTLNGQKIRLTNTEYKLLTCLIAHEGRLLSHDFLLRQVWGGAHGEAQDHLHLYISYLRKKIERDPRNPRYIHNRWGVGYRFG